jgi:hypothetical protein
VTGAREDSERTRVAALESEPAYAAIVMPARRTTTAAQTLERRRRIMRIELSTGIGCALIGVAFRMGGHTLREMSIFRHAGHRWRAGGVVLRRRGRRARGVVW